MDEIDQGSHPTYKGEIIWLYEQGMQPPDIARENGHNLKSMERYLKDYERVKLMLKRGSGVAEISMAIGRGQSVVVEYIEIAESTPPPSFLKRRIQRSIGYGTYVSNENPDLFENMDGIWRIKNCVKVI